MTKSTNADELYDSLSEGITNPRLMESLSRVKLACDFLESSKASISVTSVGRYCQDRWDGPKAQSIRNAKDTLFAYFQVRQARQVIPEVARKQSYEPLIQDETVRAYVALLKSERDEAIRLKNRIVAGLRTIPGLPIDDLIASGFKPIPQKTEAAAVSDEARGALARLFQAEKLSAVGLELYRDRLRHMTTKQILLEKADVEALHSLMRGESAPSGGLPLITQSGGQE
jgi:hypothetical protein